MFVQEVMGAYCLPLLADYVVLVASPTHSRGSERGGWSEGGDSAGSSLPPLAWSSLRQGAYALYGACSSSEVSPHPQSRILQKTELNVFAASNFVWKIAGSRMG
jgi:hypothetical protein